LKIDRNDFFISNNNERATMAIINYLFSPIYENPRGFSIRFVFAKLGAQNTQQAIYKTVVGN
jgi:hypothetical protein